MTPWETLGVSKGASQDEIKRAWRRIALQFHPDRGGDPDAFKRALLAYEVMSGRWRTDAPSNYEQNEEYREYAEAYYDAWNSVPDRVRFWFSFFKFLNVASMFFAQPLFFGGSLLLLVGLFFGKPGKPSDETVTRTAILATVSGVLVLTLYSKFWDRLRVRLQDQYSFTRARESTSKGLALRKSVPNAAPDRKGWAAGCAVIMAFMLGLSLFAIATSPNSKVHPAVAVAIYGAMFGIPMVLLLWYAFRRES